MKEKWTTLRYLNFFRDFSDEQITEVVDASDWIDYHKGDTIVAEGEIETSFYIIAKGGVEVWKNDALIGRMYQGDCFGETAFIKHQQRPATITARTDVMLMVVSSSVLDKVSMETQLQYYRIFLETLVTRLSKATDQLIEQDKAK